MSHIRSLGITVVGVPLFYAFSLSSAPILIPNGSFESPSVAFVSTEIDDWQKTPKPEGYDETGGFLWSQLTGLFKNTPPGSADHIDNCDGSQAVWVFAVPGAGLFQEPSPSARGGLSDLGGPTVFQVGHSYHLSAGVIGMGGGMSNGVTLEIALYYRDKLGNQTSLATAIVTNSPAVFSNRTHLIDFHAELPVVRNEDPWANQPLGIRLLSTVRADLQGGYWDLDNIRLRAISAPVLSATSLRAEGITLQIESEPGLVLEVLSAGQPGASSSGWAHLITVTNQSGLVSVPISASANARFFRARELGIE